MQHAAVSGEIGNGGIDQGFRQSLPRNQRLTRPPTAQQRAFHHRPEQRGQRLLRHGVERRDRQRFEQFAIEFRARQHALHAGTLGGFLQPGEGKIVGQFGARHAARQNPPGDAAWAGGDSPALAAADIDEGKHRPPRSAQRVACADGGQILHHRVIAGEQQMIAVIQPHAECLVEIRSAPPTRRRSRLIERGANAGLGEADSRRQPGHARADDVDVPQNHA